MMNHGLSIRSKKKDGHGKERSKRHFNMSSLRGMNESESTSKLSQIIQTERHAISANASAASDRSSVATQLSLWGLSTNDDSVSEISDKVGVIMSELAEQEDTFTQSLEDYRSLLKKIKDIEKSVQPSRDSKKDTSDEIQKLKYKDPSSTKLVTLEQELVRAEAQNLVAEAQLTNNTRQKLKAACDIHFAATIERAQKQLILATYGRRLLNYFDDSPVVPGDERQPFAYENEVRQLMSDAEQELQSWQPNLEPLQTSAGNIGNNLMPTDERETLRSPTSAQSEQFGDDTTLHHAEGTSTTTGGLASK